MTPSASRALIALAAALACTLTARASARPAQPAFTPERIKAHVSFLADDLLEGRETGTRGYAIAANYVAQQFAALGLKPAGDAGGWFQQVTFQETRRGPAAVTISGPAGVRRFEHGGDAIVGLNPAALRQDVSAPLVFVGFGLDDPAQGLDDYRGLDVRGKIVVVLRGFPKGLSSEVGAHLNAAKAATAKRRGAIGMLAVATKLSAATVPWATILRYADEPDFTWVDKDGKPFTDDAVGLTAGLNAPAAEAAFAGAPRKLSAILAEADRVGGRPRGFALRTSARLEQAATARRTTSPNVAAILPGSDPTLAAEHVALSAHLDHLGIAPAKPGEAADADRISNGALDNAGGVATMLEVARAAATAPTRPRRSILFLALTAEEKGLLGADYYARHPTVPIDRIVANVNLDMPLLLYPFSDVIAFGAERSTLGRTVAETAAAMNLKLIPDPMAEQGIFTRSDHYMFVKQGVPAVFFATGYADGGEQAWKRFFADHYHRPSDDLKLPIDWQAGARFAEVNYRLTRAIADADARPHWYRGDFFGDLFAPRAEKAARD